MQNVHSSAFTVTCAHSHNLLKIHVKMDISIEMRRNFLQGDKCVYVMGNGSKIKIDSSVKSEKLNVKSNWLSVIGYRLSGNHNYRKTGKRVASYGFRVTGYALRVIMIYVCRSN